MVKATAADAMAYRFVFYEGVTEAMVLDMEERIGSICYPEFAGCAAGQLEVYRKNRRSRVALFNKDELIGYACMLPITDEAYLTVKEGLSDNFLLRPDQVEEYEAGGHYKLYIDGFAIVPEERDYALSRRLVSAVFFEVGRMAEEGVEVDEIICYVTDRRVARLLEIEGFTKTRGASGQIYVCSIKKERFPVIPTTGEAVIF